MNILKWRLMLFPSKSFPEDADVGVLVHFLVQLVVGEARPAANLVVRCRPCAQALEGGGRRFAVMLPTAVMVSRSQGFRFVHWILCGWLAEKSGNFNIQIKSRHTLRMRRMMPWRTPNWTSRCSSILSECGLKRRQRSRIVVPYVIPLEHRKKVSKNAN